MPHSLHGGSPCLADSVGEGLLGDVFRLVEEDDEDEEPGDDGCDDPVVTSLFPDDRGDPDTELNRTSVPVLPRTPCTHKEPNQGKVSNDGKRLGRPERVPLFGKLSRLIVGIQVFIFAGGGSGFDIVRCRVRSASSLLKVLFLRRMR